MDSKIEQLIAPFDCRFEEFWEDFLNPTNGRISKGIITFAKKLHGENPQKFLSLLSSKGNSPMIYVLREVITNPMYAEDNFKRLQKLNLEHRCLLYKSEYLSDSNEELSTQNTRLEIHIASLQKTNQELKAQMKGLRAGIVALILLAGASEGYRRYTQNTASSQKEVTSPAADITKEKTKLNRFTFSR